MLDNAVQHWRGIKGKICVGQNETCGGAGNVPGGTSAYLLSESSDLYKSGISSLDGIWGVALDPERKMGGERGAGTP